MLKNVRKVMVSAFSMFKTKPNRAISKRKRLGDHRPARTIQGEFGPIEVPDTRDSEACVAFAKGQIILTIEAVGANNRRRRLHHVANTYLVFVDPIDTLNRNKKNMSLHSYQAIKRQIETYLDNPPRGA